MSSREDDWQAVWKTKTERRADRRFLERNAHQSPSDEEKPARPRRQTTPADTDSEAARAFVAALRRPAGAAVDDVDELFAGQQALSAIDQLQLFTRAHGLNCEHVRGAHAEARLVRAAIGNQHRPTSYRLSLLPTRLALSADARTLHVSWLQRGGGVLQARQPPSHPHCLLLRHDDCGVWADARRACEESLQHARQQLAERSAQLKLARKQLRRLRPHAPSVAAPGLHYADEWRRWSSARDHLTPGYMLAEEIHSLRCWKQYLDASAVDGGCAYYVLQYVPNAASMRLHHFRCAAHVSRWLQRNAASTAPDEQETALPRLAGAIPQHRIDFLKFRALASTTQLRRVQKARSLRRQHERTKKLTAFC